MAAISARGGGCLRKVNSQALSEILEGAGLSASRRSDFLDAERWELPSSVGALATTTDLIFDFGAPAADFGWIAATHALSDLYAVLAQPAIATVALGVTSGSLHDGTASAIMRGFLDALTETGVALGGGHTVLTELQFLSVSSVGLDPLITDPAWLQGQTYELLISKPLGSGLYLSAHANDLLPPARFRDELLPLLRESNAAAAADLRRLHSAEPGAIAFITDVTGFGLLLALDSAMVAGCRAQIRVADVPVLKEAQALVAQQGIASGLGEHNMLTVVDDPRFAISVALEAQVVLNDPQTSGGLLTAVTEESARWILANATSTWSSIGTVHVTHETDLPITRVL